MTKLRRLLLPAALALSAMLGLGGSGIGTEAPALAAPPVMPGSTPRRDPKAMDLLRKSVDAMRALKTYGIHADVTHDFVVRDGFKLQRAETQDVLVREPNAMSADVSGDKGHRRLVYDGRSMSFLVEPENYYATVSAPPTLEAALDDIISRYNVDLPVTDLIYLASGGNLEQPITDAGYIGTSRVAGVDCEHLGFRTPAVDWQLWIDDKTLLPRKVVVTTRDEPSAPQYQAVLAWDTAPRIADASFVLKRPPDAKLMTLENRDGTVGLLEQKQKGEKP
jgi:hypothetical protein